MCRKLIVTNELFLGKSSVRGMSFIPYRRGGSGVYRGSS